jgi:curved DNA-binding protein CbpA
MIWPLDRVLVHLHLVAEAKLGEALMEISKTKTLLGRHLVAKGACSRHDVLRALRLQLVLKLVNLSDLPLDTAYAFYAGVNLIKDYGGPELLRSEPLATIMAAIRASSGHAAAEATLVRIARVPLGLVPNVDVTRFELSREEAAVCDLLRAKRLRLAELVAAGAAPEHVVKRTIYALTITRHLDLGVAQKPPVAFQPLPPSSVDMEPPRSRRAPPAIEPAEAPRSRRGPQVIEPAEPPRSRTPQVIELAEAPRSRRAPQVAPAAPVAPAPVAPPPRAATLPSPAARSAAAQPPAPQAAAPQPPAAQPRTAPAARAAAPAIASAKPPAAVPITTPKSGTIDITARRAEIQARSASIENETYFDVLGVAKTAAGEDIRNAYFALAKRWHPDRTPPELAELKPLVASVFAKIGEAYAALGDADKRAAYLKSLESPLSVRSPAEEEQVVRAVNAALEFQKAEALLKKNDVLGAERHIRLAADADPGQPEYTTLLVWVAALRRGEPQVAPGTPTSHYDDLIGMLDEVLRGDPRYERALFYRGTLLKRSGRLDKALRDFRLAAEMNPRNLDAQREVRLHEMRKRDGRDKDGGEQPGGIFGKWFKR